MWSGISLYILASSGPPACLCNARAMDVEASSHPYKFPCAKGQPVPRTSGPHEVNGLSGFSH